MNAFRIRRYAAASLACPVLAALLLLLLPGNLGAAEEKFDVLQIGTQTFSNVTVTTKAKQYVFLLHSAGMASIKVSQLPPEVLEKLGYTTPAAKVTTNTAVVWAKQEIAKINTPQVRELGKQLGQKWRGKPLAALSAIGLIGPRLIVAVLGIALLLYLFQCYCFMLICRKTGQRPGILIWLPVAQVFPLLRAAGMSGWWFLALLVPVLNLVASVLWCFKIAKARGKSVWVGVLLVLPITSLFAFLYLAFSNGVASDEDEEPEPKIMTLQAA
jgi:hypothetical protein